MKISTVLAQIELGQMTLPEFQRGYVWNRNQVRGLMQSLYRDYPIGGLLVWTTEAEPDLVRDGRTEGGVIKLLLDGQQRMTSLYGVMRGEPPRFFQGNEQAFRDLHFDVRTETFEFYGPVKMGGDPHWVSVTELFQRGVEPVIEALADHIPDVKTSLAYQVRLSRVASIGDRNVYIEDISGPDKGIDEVVEIFNRVNSGGTKLSKGDLALARISADRPAARNELRAAIAKWNGAGYNFALDWLLRVVNAVVTGQSRFTALRDVSPDDFAAGISRSTRAVNFLLNLVSSRLGLDHNRVLAGRYAFPIMARVFDTSDVERDSALQSRLLHWYIHSFMWGRYSGSTESVLQQDLEAYERSGFDGLIDQIRRMRGTLEVRPDDFDSWSVGSRFYPVLYMLSRVHGARDLKTGMELKASMLGRESALQVHHLFPKSLLYDTGFDRPATNALANYSFLTASSNLSVGASDPAGYLPELEAAHPGVLASQWIPMDRSLWSIEQYPAFAAGRRELMAAAINEFLVSLVDGQVEDQIPTFTDAVALQPAGYAEDPEVEEVLGVVRRLGLSLPEVHYEIVDEDSGEVLAMADLAWPIGVQEGLTEPLAFLVEADAEMESRLSALGFRFFVEVQKLLWYLEEVLGEDIDGDGIQGDPHVRVDDVPSSSSAVVDPSSNGPEVERRFHQAMVEIYNRAKAETGYSPTRFGQMLGEHGGVATAKQLLAAPTASDGFTTLWEKGRLDLTVEAHALKPEFEALFSRDELNVARRRLEQMGYQK